MTQKQQLELVVFSLGGKNLNKDLGNCDIKVGDYIGKCSRQRHKQTATLLIKIHLMVRQVTHLNPEHHIAFVGSASVFDRLSLQSY